MIILMLVKDLQQFLGTFTDKLKGNAVSHAKIYVEKNGYLEEIKRIINLFSKSFIISF